MWALNPLHPLLLHPFIASFLSGPSRLSFLWLFLTVHSRPLRGVRKEKEVGVWTTHCFPSVHWSCHYPDFSKWPPLQSADETFITILKKVIPFPYLPEETFFSNSSHITNSIGMMLCGIWDSPYSHLFGVVSAGWPNEVKRPEVTSRNVLSPDHFHVRATGFSAIRLLHHADAEQPK